MLKSFLTNIKLKLALFLAVLGPGIITAVADNDAGGVATYTVGAALYGMNSQFLIIPITFILALTQEIGARIAIVARKGLGDLIRERYGVKVSLVIFILYFITNQGVVLQNISGLKASFQLFNLPWQVLLILTCLILILTVVKLDYKRTQKIFLFLLVFYISYIISAVLAKPNWGEALRQSLILPDRVYWFNLSYWFTNIAILGTTITAWGQFFVHSYIIDKKLHIQHLNLEKIEVYLGAFITNFFSWMMALAVTYTLFVNQIHEVDGYTAALAMKPVAGTLAFAFFSLGLFGASILGLTIVPLATAYVFSEMFGYEGTLDASFRKGRLFYIFFILQIVVGLLITLLPKVNLFRITLYVDYLNGAMLPVIFYFLVKLASDREVMGDYKITGFKKYALLMSALVISLAVLVTFIGKILRIG